MMAKSATRWVPLFRRFIKEIRIQSKHATSDPDGIGIPLKLWTSQKRLLDEICAGLDDDIHVYYLLKSRQVGATTITAALLIFWLALHPNTIGCLALDTDKNSAKKQKDDPELPEVPRGLHGQIVLCSGRQQIWV